MCMRVCTGSLSCRYFYIHMHNICGILEFMGVLSNIRIKLGRQLKYLRIINVNYQIVNASSLMGLSCQLYQ